MLLIIVLLNVSIISSFKLHYPHEPPPPKDKMHIKKIAGIIFVSSFIPYFLDDDIKPSAYKDGLTRHEITLKNRRTELSNYINGDINYLNSVFPNFEIKSDIN